MYHQDGSEQGVEGQGQGRLISFPQGNIVHYCPTNPENSWPLIRCLMECKVKLAYRPVGTSTHNHWHDTPRNHCTFPAPQQCHSLTWRNSYISEDSICIFHRFLHAKISEDLFMMYLDTPKMAVFLAFYLYLHSPENKNT